MAPLERSTPHRPPPQTHAFITRCEFGGLAPGQIPWILVEWCGGVRVAKEPEAWEFVDTRAFKLEGDAAVAFMKANREGYEPTKKALYRLLVDEGFEQGDIT